ncbi:DUF2513 domain-containing protein [Limosilactobacillus mucosae]|uniref:DUF2513 domain-containing protein n=1 Tax=Limosilactobacillus mucosae TaxID=97478 RepID=UPI003D08FEB9
MLESTELIKFISLFSTPGVFERINAMKLNYDLVRYVLLSIEESKEMSGPSEKTLLTSIKKYGNFDWNDIAYTIDKLNEANFITGKVAWANNKPTLIRPGNLTLEGHKFLDNIRDSKIWKSTKDKISKLENVSLNIISSVAANLISNKLGL